MIRPWTYGRRVLRFAVNAEDLLHTRFAISPIQELQGLLRKLSGLSTGSLPPGLEDQAA